MGLTQDICEIIHATTYESLGTDCIHRVKEAIKDGVAVALAGSKEEPVTILTEHLLSLGGLPQASIWGSGRKVSVVQAAYVNSVATHVQDFEPMWSPPTHAVSPTVPVAFALLAVAGVHGAAPSAPAAWPEFRGPTGQGLSTATDLPLEWSPTKNVRWKQPLPGTGWSSPVVGGGHIYLTTAVASVGDAKTPSLRVLALDVASGRTLWDTEVFTPAEAKPQPIHQKNSEASPTPILADGKLYVHFGHHGTAALDLTGKILWRNQALGYDAVHGNGGPAGCPVVGGRRPLPAFNRSCGGPKCAAPSKQTERTTT